MGFGTEQASPSDRVLAVHLRKTDDSPPESSLFRARLPTVSDLSARNAHFAHCKRACLVENNVSNLGSRLERRTTLDQNALLGTDTSANHDSSRSCQTKRTRTSEDNDSDTQLDADHHPATTGFFEEDRRRIGEEVTERHPSDECRQTKSDNDRYEVTSDHVSHALDRSAASLSLLDQTDDLAELCISASTCDFVIHATSAVYSTSHEVRAGVLEDGHSFSSDHAFVDVALATGDGSIGGDLVTGLEDHDIADLEEFGRNSLFLDRRAGGILLVRLFTLFVDLRSPAFGDLCSRDGVGIDQSSGRCQTHESAKRFAGLTLGAVLQEAAE